MAPDSEPTNWPFPEGGLNTEYDSRYVPVTELIEAENIFYKAGGMIRSRAGFEELYAPTGATKATVMYYWSSRDELWWADDSGSLWNGSTEVSGPTNNVTDMVVYGFSGDEKLFVAEEKGSEDHTIHVYDPSDGSYSELAGEGVPNVTKLMVRYDQLWGTCNPDDGDESRIYWSDYGDPTTWVQSYGGSGFLTLSPSYHGDIIGWTEREGILYVAKNNGWYLIKGNHPQNFQTHFIGTVSSILGDTIDDVVQGVLFCTDRGVYPMGRRFGGEPQNLSHRVQEDLAESLTSSSKAAYSEEFGGYLIADGTSTVWVSASHARPDIWTRFTFPFNVTNIYSADALYLATDDGRVMKYDNDRWDDNGTDYDVKLQTGFWDMGSEVMRSAVKYLEGPMSAGGDCDLTVTIYKDDDPNSPVVSGGWHIGEDDLQALKLNFEARSMSIELEYSDLSSPAYYRGMRLYARGVRPEIS